MKAVTVGGHLTPALALMDHTSHHQLGVQWWFFGRIFSRPGQKAVESDEVQARKATFIAFNSPKLAGRTWQWPWLLPQLVWAILVALQKLSVIKPDVVVVFGGYLAVPVVLAAKLLRIKVVAHEQTMVPGLANRLIVRFADQIALSFPETVGTFPKQTTSVIGNAIRPAAFNQNLPQPTWYINDKNLPILVVTGGSQGSQAINQAVLKILPELLSKWYVVHQIGHNDGTQADGIQQSLRKLADEYPNYVCAAWLNAEDLFWLYRQHARTICRSGANTIYELAVMAVPAILVPLPGSADGEQQAHAKWLESIGGATILEQNELSTQKLLAAIDDLDRTYALRQLRLQSLHLPIDATAKLFLLMKYVAP